MSEYTQEERDALAYMVMRSLRGSFFPVNPRCEILTDLAESGLSVYDSKRLIEKIEWHVERDYADGRTFRHVYQEGPSLSEITDEDTARSLIGHIPDDMTWGPRAIEREFEESHR